MTDLKRTKWAKRLERRAKEVAGRPIRSASLFYTLYYLSEMEDVEEAQFDLFQITNELYDGLYYYGLHTITAELDSARGSFNIDGEQLKDKTEQEVVDYFEDNISNDNETPAIRAMMELHNGGESPTTSVLRAWMSYAFIEQVAQLKDDPMEWVSTCHEIYSLYDKAYYRAGPDDDYDYESYSGWTGAYGGPGWESVCQHILNREELTKIAWVDQSWSVQHNGGNWIDKINMDEKEFHVIAEEAVPHIFMKGTERSDLRFEDLLRALNDHLLDANLDGDMRTVFSYAEHYQDEVDINITRYKNRLL